MIGTKSSVQKQSEKTNSNQRYYANAPSVKRQRKSEKSRNRRQIPWTGHSGGRGRQRGNVVIAPAEHTRKDKARWNSTEFFFHVIAMPLLDGRSRYEV